MGSSSGLAVAGASHQGADAEGVPSITKTPPDPFRKG